jgi:hypothetical protein
MVDEDAFEMPILNGWELVGKWLLSGCLINM